MFLEFMWTWKWMKTMEGKRECGWSPWRGTRHLKDAKLQDECRCRHLRLQDCSQDKTRVRENTSLSSTHQFGRISVVKISILYLEGLKPSLYRRRTGHEVQEAYTRSYPKGPLQISHFLAPKVSDEGSTTRMF